MNVPKYRIFSSGISRGVYPKFVEAKEVKIAIKRYKKMEIKERGRGRETYIIKSLYRGSISASKLFLLMMPTSINYRLQEQTDNRRGN